MTVLTQEEINHHISIIDEQTKVSPRNNSKTLPPIIRSTSAPPICWTSVDEEFEAPESSVPAIYSSIEYSQFYYKCQEAQRKKLHPPKCPQRITRRKILPRTPKSSHVHIYSPRNSHVRIFSPKLSTSTAKTSSSVHMSSSKKNNALNNSRTSSKKNTTLNSNRTSSKKQSGKATVKAVSSIVNVDNWFESRKTVAPNERQCSNSYANQQIPENEHIYELAQGIPPTRRYEGGHFSYEDEKHYPSDFRYDDPNEFNYDGSYNGYPYNEYPYNEYPYNEYPCNEHPYNEHPYNEHPYNEYSYNGYPYSGYTYKNNEFPYEETYSQISLPPRTHQAPEPIPEAQHPKMHSTRGTKQDMMKMHSTRGTKQDMMVNIKTNDPQSLQSAIDTGYLTDIITCSEGSRLIQKLIEVASPEEKTSAFNILCPNIIEIAKDQFGNYVIQKFFEFGNEEHKPYIIQKLFGQIMSLSLHSFGCRVVQKAIEHSSHSPDILAMLLREIQESDGISKCMYDPNGNHVIQRFIEKAPSYVIDSIMKACKGNVASLAQNKFGCRIVQKLLQHCTQKQKNVFVKQIIERAIPLSYNAFGNYVIQFLLENDSKTQKEIIARVYKDFLKLSLNKYGSNVVEKCIVYGDDDDRELFFNFVLPKKLNKNSRIVEMMKNEFGNYVIQRMIGLANEKQLYRLHDYTRSLDVKLCSFPFGKYIQSRMDKVIKQNQLPN